MLTGGATSVSCLHSSSLTYVSVFPIIGNSLLNHRPVDCPPLRLHVSFPYLQRQRVPLGQEQADKTPLGFSDITVGHNFSTSDDGFYYPLIDIS